MRSPEESNKVFYDEMYKYGNMEEPISFMDRVNEVLALSEELDRRRKNDSYK